MIRATPSLCITLLACLTTQGIAQNDGVLIQQVGGAGAGDVTFTQVTVLDTDVTSMPIECQSFVVQPNVTVTVRGSRPLVVKASSLIRIFGTLDASGQNGSSSSAGVAGAGSGRGGFGPEPGAGPSGGGAGDGTNGGGGGGHATAGGDGGFTGCVISPGGAALGGGPFVSEFGAGSGGGGAGTTADPAGGGGAGGVVRLRANIRIDVLGTIRVNGGIGGTNQFGIAAGSGSGGLLELVSPTVDLSGFVFASGGPPSALAGTPCGAGGRGGDGWVAIYADDLPSGSVNILGQKALFDHGMVLDDLCASMSFLVGPSSQDLFNPGPACFVFYALNLLPPGQEIAAGSAGSLFLNPIDPLFPLTSPLQHVTTGQGSPAGPFSFGRIDLDLTSLVPAIEGAGVSKLVVNAQGLQVDATGVVHISPVRQLRYISTSF